MNTQLKLNLEGPPGANVLMGGKYFQEKDLEDYILKRRGLCDLYSRQYKVTFEASIIHIKELLGEPTYQEVNALIDNNLYSIYEDFWFYTNRSAYKEFVLCSAKTEGHIINAEALNVLNHVVVCTKYTNLNDHDPKFPHKFFVSIANGFRSDKITKKDMLSAWVGYFKTHIPKLTMTT